MAWRVLIRLFLLATIDLCAGKIMMKPRDMDAKVNHSSYFNCSTDLVSSDIFWFHGNNYIYTGHAILEPYNERFTIERYTWNRTYIFNLVIHSVQPGDAGEYSCIDDDGFGNKYSSQLVVLDGDPICRSNIELNEVIGQNTCNVEPDEVELSCSGTFHGNIPPQLEWKKDGEDSKVLETLSNAISNNHYNYILKLKGDISLDKSFYVCQAARIAHEPLNCISKDINVLYALSDNSTVNRSLDDEILCRANTTQSCNYQWRWFQNNDVTTESSSAILKPRKTGLHKCAAECYIRNQTCNMQVMRVIVVSSLVNGNTESSQTKNVIVYVSVVVAVVVILLMVAAFIFVFRHRIAGVMNKEKATGERRTKECVALNKLQCDKLLAENDLQQSDELFQLPAITEQNMVDTLTINKYFIDRGTSGAIYGPFRWKIKKCALKQILYSPDKVTDKREEEIAQLRNRCRELDHPHLVKVFEMWFPSPALYILMEYAEGKSLDKILRPKDAPPPLEPFSFVIVTDWALQIADGMKYLHCNNLVHRNLKSAHVLVMEPSDVFRYTLKIGSYTLARDHDHSTVMSLKGTMAWMAPEYICGEQFSTLSDVWSYGVTVWEILTRDVPFKEIRKETDLVRSAIRKALKLNIPEYCPEKLREVLTDCWIYEVNERPSFTKICDALTALHHRQPEIAVAESQ